MTHYDTLQISKSASGELIEKAYNAVLQQTKKIHEPEKSKKIEEIEEAYKTLSNPAARRMYDIMISINTKNYQPQPQPQNHTGQNILSEETTKKDEAAKFCTECGTPILIGSKFCENCGSPILKSKESRIPPEKVQQQNFNPAIKEQRRNMHNLYDAILSEKNRIYYLTKFEYFDQQGPGLKASWNWPALLAGGVWALYRKMYGWFFAFWGVAFLSNIFEKAGSPGLSAIIFLVPWIAFPIYADSLYHNSIKKKIAVAQLSAKEEPKLLEYLRYKGGVHTWVIWVFGGLPIIGILAAIFIPMFARH